MPTLRTIFILTILYTQCLIVIGQSNSEKIDSIKSISSHQMSPAECKNLLQELKELGVTREYFIKKIGESNRTPVLHDYYMPYLNHICINTDSTYKAMIFERLVTNENGIRGMIYPLLNCMFHKDVDKKSSTIDYIEKLIEYVNESKTEIDSSKTIFIERLNNAKSELRNK